MNPGESLCVHSLLYAPASVSASVSVRVLVAGWLIVRPTVGWLDAKKPAPISQQSRESQFDYNCSCAFRCASLRRRCIIF